MRELNVIYLFFLTSILYGCASSLSFPDKPNREPFVGFKWGVVEGANMKLWAQSNDKLKVEVVDSLNEVYIFRADNGVWKPLNMVVKVFDLPSEDINDLIQVLLDGDSDDLCEFKVAEESKQEGVTRYTLHPFGDSLKEYEKQAISEAIPSTCNGWGIGNSGYRYFEVFENQKDKVIFVEIGQEVPLFDEHSITLLK